MRKGAFWSLLSSVLYFFVAKTQPKVIRLSHIHKAPLSSECSSEETGLFSRTIRESIAAASSTGYLLDMMKPKPGVGIEPTFNFNEDGTKMRVTVFKEDCFSPVFQKLMTSYIGLGENKILKKLFSRAKKDPDNVAIYLDKTGKNILSAMAILDHKSKQCLFFLNQVPTFNDPMLSCKKQIRKYEHCNLGQIMQFKHILDNIKQKVLQGEPVSIFNFDIDTVDAKMPEFSIQFRAVIIPCQASPFHSVGMGKTITEALFKSFLQHHRDQDREIFHELYFLPGKKSYLLLNNLDDSSETFEEHIEAYKKLKLEENKKITLEEHKNLVGAFSITSSPENKDKPQCLFFYNKNEKNKYQDILKCDKPTKDEIVEASIDENAEQTLTKQTDTKQARLIM